MGTEQGTKSERIRLADCCLVGVVIGLAAIMLCGLMTVITHVLVDEPTVAGSTIATTEIATVRGQFHVPGRGYIDGRAAADAPVQTEIQVWESVSGTRVLCRLPHRAAVFISAARWVDEEGCYYLRVRSGLCEGWVSDLHVNPRLQAPEAGSM